MKMIRHGLSVGIERTGADFYLSLRICGKLTHHDYEVIMPMLDSAIEGIKDPDIKALVDVTEFEGWEVRAAWDDLKLGVKHGRKFSKIAIVGNKKWQEYMSKIGSWFIAGSIEFFEDIEAALTWLDEEA